MFINFQFDLNCICRRVPVCPVCAADALGIARDPCMITLEQPLWLLFLACRFCCFLN